MSVDLYKILGIEPDATASEVKDAYRRLAMRFHPDQNPGDVKSEERFKEIAHAYDVLSDEKKRRAYDRIRRGPGGGLGQGPPVFENFGDLFDILNSVISAGFSGGARAGHTGRGEDITVSLTVTLKEVMTGVRRDVTVPRFRECTRCKGSGAEPGTRLRTCPSCKGKGEVRTQQGFFSLLRTCKECQGRGKLVETPCRRCSGEGQIEGTELLPIDVPEGVRHGQKLRWSGKGAPGRNGEPSGDLLVAIKVREDPLFTREGQDLHLSFPISFTQASLGAKVEVPTLDGKVVMKVPPGTQAGRVFRLRGKGLPGVAKDPQGDQYVRLEIRTPEQLSKRQKEMREQFEARSSDDDKGRGIWKRVRDFFG